MPPGLTNEELDNLLAGMSEEEWVETQLRARWELARNDPVEYFRFFAFSCDTHDLEHPVKPFPVERPHVYWRTKIWHEIWSKTLRHRDPKSGQMVRTEGIVDAKSGQNLATWTYTGVSSWDVLFHPNRLVFLQSETEYHAIGKEATGDGLLGRCKFILRNIPGREILIPEFNPEKAFLTNTIELPWGSVLWAVAQGGHIVRSHTLSGLLSDEAGFQPELMDAYTAAQPRLRGGGWIVLVSTPEPGSEFQKIAEDRIE